MAVFRTVSPPGSLMSVPASLLLGALLGAANAVAAVWVVRRALALAPQRAMQIVLGSMVARMGVVLALFALVVILLPVHRVAFVAGLGALFVIGLLAETFLVLTRPPADA